MFFMNIASNGIRLHVADQGKGALAIVFLHGWGASTRTWEHVIAALPPGYRTVAIDQRGWGSSDHPASGYSLAELADDTEGAIKALGLERYILVGHSMGGKTVQFLASRRPKGLAGLVLLASAPPSPFTVPEQLRVRMSNCWSPMPSGARPPQELHGVARPALRTLPRQLVTSMCRPW